MRLLLILLVFAVSANATTYYVANVSQARTDTYYDTKASNSNNGTTVSTPFLTLKYAQAQLSAGDTLFIMGGVWNDTMKTNSLREVVEPHVAALWIYTSGTTGNPIVYKSKTGRDSLNSFPMAELQCNDFGSANNANWGAGIVMEDIDYIVIDSIHFDSCSLAGIYWFTCDSIVVKNSVIHDIWAWINIGEELNCGGLQPNGLDGNPGDTNSFNLIYGNTIYNIRDAAGDIGQSDNANGIQVRGLRNSIVRNNTVYNTTIGMRFKSKVKRTLIDSNFIYNCYEAGIALSPGADVDTVRFNVYWQGDGDAAGIMLQDNDGYNDIDSIYIYNNTLIGARQTRAGISLGDYSSTGIIDNNHVFNNIVVNFNRDFSAEGDNADELWKQFANSEEIIDYNCYYDTSSTDVVNYTPSGSHQTLTEWQAVSPYDDNSVNLDPQFLNLTPGNPNFLRLDTDNTPAALLTGGRGGEWPTYMGAFDPYPASGGETTKAQITGKVSLSGKVDIGE